MQRRADLVGELGQHQIVPAAGDAVEFGADVEQRQVGAGQRTQRVVGFAHGQPVGEVGDGQRVEQLNVAQSAAAHLEIRFGAVRDLAAAAPPGMSLFDEFAEQRLDSGPPLATDSVDEPIRELLVARDVPGIEHGQTRRHVGTGDLQGLRHGPNAVVETNVGVP
ncbi:hypothetical protein MCOO_49850 [Mycobacterium cookii]|uniref:Uncharacterized protein n=1 Tax=Mycobacterium cookii TaxID=1775 RepID=A0A7I7L3L5_9MYCO|nr:hypothetical protein MCOO_49850 [Mycobacterium cookii]